MVDLRILAPRWVFVGDEVSVGIEAIVHKPMDIVNLQLYVEAHSGWSAKGGTENVIPFSEVLMLAGGQTLKRGRHTYTATFRVPEQVPHSHRIGIAWSSIILTAHATPPRGLGYTVRRSMIARAPFAGRLVPAPATAQSSPPGVELDLVSSLIPVGGDVIGMMRAHDTPRVGLDLIAKVLVRSTVYETRSIAFVSVDVPESARGRPMPFRIPIPDDTPPTVTTPTHQIVWQLRASSANREVLVPLVLVDRDATPGDEELSVAPAGDPELDATFEQLARDGWRFEGTIERDPALGWIRPTLRRDGLSLGFTYARGTRLVARVRYRALGLALQLDAGGFLRRGTKLAGHRVTGRTYAQAEPFVRAISEHLGSELGALVRWDDDEIVFERPAAVDEATLRAMSAALERLAGAIEAARTAIRPPRVVVDAAEWAELARELGGEVAPGDLAIRGKVGVHPVVIRIAGGAIRVELGSKRSTTANALSSRFAIANPSKSDDPIVAHATWRPGVKDLVLEEGVVRATLSLRGRIEAEPVRELVEALRHVHAALVPQGGMYR